MIQRLAGQDDLRIEVVGKDLQRRPLARRRPRAKARARLVHHLFQLVCQLGLNLGWVLVAQEAEQHVAIRVGLGHGVDPHVQRGVDVDRFRIRHAEILALRGFAAPCGR